MDIKDKENYLHDQQRIKDAKRKDIQRRGKGKIARRNYRKKFGIRTK